MPVDSTALTSSLRRLADPADRGIDLHAALEEVTAACRDLLQVTGSGIMLADDQNACRYVAATDGPGRILETVEAEAGQGPCTQAFVTNTAVAVADVTDEPRWPDLAAAVGPLGVRAVMGAPVRLGAVPVGTIDIYLDVPHEWDEAEMQALIRYSSLIETTLAAALSAHKAEELADQLQYALDHRVVVERGIGYLMGREGIDAVAAFNRLRGAARSRQTKIGEVARQLLETGRLPAGPSRPPRS